MDWARITDQRDHLVKRRIHMSATPRAILVNPADWNNKTNGWTISYKGRVLPVVTSIKQPRGQVTAVTKASYIPGPLDISLEISAIIKPDNFKPEGIMKYGNDF
jgi:hypothetical protein